MLLDKTDREADDVAADDEREELLEELGERRGTLVYSESRSPAPEAMISIGRHFTEIY